ncbi:MAG: hypothetical protein ACHQ1H_10745, partial [Nitrososphaerales archaeon]
MIFGKSPPPESNENRYTPYHYGLPRNSTFSGVSEFFVYAVKRNEDDTPEKILQLFQSHNGKLISATVSPGNDPRNEFVVDCFLDTTKLDCQPDDLLIFLRKMKIVKRAEKLKMAGRLYSSYLFPFMATGNRRSVVMDAESLLAAENAMGKEDPSLGKIVSKKFFEQGRAQGIVVAKEFASNEVPANKQDEYTTEAAKSYLRAAGWGVIGYNFDRELFTVNVAEPPVIKNGDGYFVGGNYLKGILAGLLESKFTNGARLAVTHETYNKERNFLSVYYA